MAESRTVDRARAVVSTSRANQCIYPYIDSTTNKQELAILAIFLAPPGGLDAFNWPEVAVNTTIVSRVAFSGARSNDDRCNAGTQLPTVPYLIWRAQWPSWCAQLGSPLSPSSPKRPRARTGHLWAYSRPTQALFELAWRRGRLHARTSVTGSPTVASPRVITLASHPRPPGWPSRLNGQWGDLNHFSASGAVAPNAAWAASAQLALLRRWHGPLAYTRGRHAAVSEHACTRKRRGRE